MPRPPAIPLQEKTRLVLAVLAKETTIAEAAKSAQVTEQSVINWRRQFVDGGCAGLAGGAADRRPEREEQLVNEIKRLKMALGEAYVEVMTWRKVGGARKVPSETSK